MNKSKNGEKWKIIDRSGGSHEVSNFGRIRSLDRIIGMDHGEGTKRFAAVFAGKVLSTPPNNHGYPQVVIRSFAGTFTARVHRLVCEAFNGSPPTDHHQVNHIDGNRANNRAENLEWATARQNTRHAIDVLGKPGGTPVLSKEQVMQIALMARAGVPNSQIAEKLGLYPQIVYSVSSGKAWREMTGIVKPMNLTRGKRRATNDRTANQTNP